jgi:hypothetical protein
MLDVHPPHHAANTWRDFFIHIATIVIGLLIAVGLEQTVEHIHLHYQLRETREALAIEAEANRKLLEQDEKDWLMTTAELKNDIAILQFIRQHPGTPQTALPGDLNYVSSPFHWRHAVWDSAQLNGVVPLMSLDEADNHQEFYSVMRDLSQQSFDTWNALNDAHRFDLADTDPTHLSPQQLEQVLQLTEVALSKHVEMGYSFGRMAHEFSDMPQTITWRNIEALRPTSFSQDKQGMAAAHARSLAAEAAGVHALDSSTPPK